MERKKVIVFHILETSSHLNSTFKLANELSCRGYTVFYFTSRALELEVKGRGFGFYSIPDKETVFPNRQSAEGKLKLINRIYQFTRKYNNDFLIGDFYDDLLADLSPDLIFVDLSLIYYSVMLYVRDVPFIITCTKVNLNESRYVPPFTSSYIPRVSNWRSR